MREVELALSGFKNSLSLLIGDEPEIARLELLGSGR